jgi:hypothetical protein
MVQDKTHPSTAHLPDTWERQDEWYNFETNPRDKGVNVLISIDEDSYEGGNMGDDHPICWYHEYDGGRVWYTAMGHREKAYEEDLYPGHIFGGVKWAMGLEELTVKDAGHQWQLTEHGFTCGHTDKAMIHLKKTRGLEWLGAHTTVEVFSISGRKMREYNHNADTFLSSFPGLSSGIYQWRIHRR